MHGSGGEEPVHGARAFRINHIVEHLDKIVELMSVNAGIRRE